jgi:lactoylglutathione lyase
MFDSIDCIRLYVPDLDEALAFYRDKLGHSLIWRSENQAGLRLPQSEAEIVLQAEREGMEVDFKVRSADAAAAAFLEAGGFLVVPPFEIQIGRCAVVRDPWGNELVLLDQSKGRLVTDQDGNILGNQPPH